MQRETGKQSYLEEMVTSLQDKGFHCKVDETHRLMGTPNVFYDAS
jgi:hypothetical protein